MTFVFMIGKIGEGLDPINGNADVRQGIAYGRPNDAGIAGPCSPDKIGGTGTGYGNVRMDYAMDVGKLTGKVALHDRWGGKGESGAGIEPAGVVVMSNSRNMARPRTGLAYSDTTPPRCWGNRHSGYGNG